MTLAQISKAVEIATSKTDLSNVDDTVLFGCGTAHFEPVLVTLRCVAKFLRWQVVMLNGEVDQQELTNLQWVLRHRIRVAGEGCD